MLQRIAKGIVCFVLISALLIQSIKPAYAGTTDSNFLVNPSTKPTQLAFVQFIPEIVPLLEAIGEVIGGALEMGSGQLVMEGIAPEIIGGITTFAVEGAMVEINPVAISAINNTLATAVKLGQQVIVKHGKTIMLSLAVAAVTPQLVAQINKLSASLNNNKSFDSCKPFTIRQDGKEFTYQNLEDTCLA